MSILVDERKEYLNNKFFTGHEYGDFTPFYIAITICAAIGAFLFALNIIFCWCSPWRDYWQDRHTGNRWIQSVWTNTPHKNPPLDLTELETGVTLTQNQGKIIRYHHQQEAHQVPLHSQQYMELQKRESDI